MTKEQMAAAAAFLEKRLLSPPELAGFKPMGMPAKVCGVYALVEGGKVVYVGKSTDVVSRVRRHRDNMRFAAEEVYVMRCAPSRLDRLERDMIVRLRPWANGIRKDGSYRGVD